MVFVSVGQMKIVWKEKHIIGNKETRDRERKRKKERGWRGIK